MRLIVAAVLLVAATLKTHQLATLAVMPSLGEGFLHARWFNIFVVEFELFFGIWLIFGMLPKLTWLATTGLFVIFSLVTFYEAAILHNISCGCFGVVVASPWITMALDLAIIGFLVLFRPKGMIFQRRKILFELAQNFQYQKIIFVVLTWLIIAIPASYAIIAVNKIDRGGIGFEFIGLDGQKTLSLTPEKWIGKQFPLIPYIEPTEKSAEILSRMNSGLWTIVLYRPNCPKCQQLLSNLSTGKMENIIYMEVPLDKKTEVFQGKNYMRLDNKKNWFLQPPVIVQTNEGLVTKIYNTDEQIDAYLSSVDQ